MAISRYDSSEEATLANGGTPGPACAGRRRFVATALALAWVPPLHAAERRLIAYVDIDTPGARAAFGRFTQALEKAWPRPGPAFDARFLPVDQTDPHAIGTLEATITRLSPWLLVATSLPTARIAHKLDAPALFYAPADPVMLGLVASTSRPGGPMTGYAGQPPSIEKMIELAAEALPDRRRLVVVTDRLFARHSSPGPELEAAARALGRSISIGLADTLEEFEALAARRFEGAEALVIPYTAVPFRHSKQVLEAAARHRLPAVHGSARLVREGGLVGIEADISDVAEVFARQAAAIAQGAAPAEIPVERPKRYLVSLNLATARRLDLRLQPAVLKRADHILE